MRLIKHTLSAAAILFGISLGAFAQSGMYMDARSVIQRTQQDLQHASTLSINKKETERISNAEHSLSNFDGDLAKGKFDKGDLDHSINDVKNVIKNNTLTPADRNALNADLEALRRIRAERGGM